MAERKPEHEEQQDRRRIEPNPERNRMIERYTNNKHRDEQEAREERKRGE
jgi:hypothetical protein